MRFKIDWASLIVGRKFTVSALFYFVFEGNFPSTSPRRAYIWRGNLTEGFLRYRSGSLYLEGLIYRGAYFRNFTVSPLPLSCPSSPNTFEHPKKTPAKQAKQSPSQAVILFFQVTLSLLTFIVLVNGILRASKPSQSSYSVP